MEDGTPRLTLNIGCGGNEIYSFHDFGCDVMADIAKPIIKINNFVMCDVSFLPFKSNTFSKVVASHLIEHLSNPSQALKEMKRIVNGVIILHYPKIYSPFLYFDPEHRWMIVNNKLFPFPKFLHHRILIPLLLKFRGTTQKMSRFRMPFFVETKIIKVKK